MERMGKVLKENGPGHSKGDLKKKKEKKGTITVRGVKKDVGRVGSLQEKEKDGSRTRISRRTHQSVIQVGMERKNEGREKKGVLEAEEKRRKSVSLDGSRNRKRKEKNDLTRRPADHEERERK